MDEFVMPKHDIFPATQRTWIDERLDGDENAYRELASHVMGLYAVPLKAYFLGTPYRTLGEAGDMVRGFFADRLSKREFFFRWRESKKRLRHWLMNAFIFYAKECIRELNRDRAFAALPEHVPAATDENPARELDRAFKVEVVRRALKIGEETCRARNLDAHWGVFLRRSLHDVPYETICAEMGISAQRARDMRKTAEERFVAAVRELLARDGASVGEIDAEIENLLEIE